MYKRLLPAAFGLALCAIAGPADARTYMYDDDGSRTYWEPEARQSARSRRDRDDYYDRDDEEERSWRRERRREQRASRRNASAHAARRAGESAKPRAAAPHVEKQQHSATPPAAQAAKPQQLAALPQVVPALPAPPAPPAAPDLEMRAVIPPDLARPVPPKQARRDGRSCLRPAARALLERIEAQFGPMQIISTCRPGARIAGSGRISKHASGEAIDFNAGRRKGEVVRWLIANHKTGGTMTYADMSHIHVDVGYHFVSLNASSGR